MNRLPWLACLIAFASPVCAQAQPVFSTGPTQTVYEYQLNYQLPWQRWYGGPGWSLGGTMPTQGAFGYSSLNGIPLPPPLGAGVYVNTPVPNAVSMPFEPGPFGMPAPFANPAMGLRGPMLPGAMNRPLPGPANGLFPTPTRMPRTERASTDTPPPSREVSSTPAAKRASIEQQNLGDQLLRQQYWTKAYVHYRNAADLTPERPEAHFRLGLSFAALKQYSSAIREFKRSLDLDPTLPQSGETLSTILGNEVVVWRSTVLSAVADWTREDVRDMDRLFLLGLMLHFDEDPRGSEILEAARRLQDSRYITPFLTPTKSRVRVPRPTTRDAEPDDLPPPPTPDDGAEATDADLPIPPAPSLPTP
jgi:hypothetical protein